MYMYQYIICIEHLRYYSDYFTAISKYDVAKITIRILLCLKETLNAPTSFCKSNANRFRSLRLLGKMQFWCPK